MNNTRKQIIELIYPYLEKDLVEGCYVQIHNNNCKVVQFTWKNLKVWRCWDERYANYKYPEHIWNLEDENNFKIIGHYDITAVLKYLQNKIPFFVSMSDLQFLKNWKLRIQQLWEIPIKTLHLYTKKEEKDLLNILLTLK